jgi:tryptophan-rich sensory protein
MSPPLREDTLEYDGIRNYIFVEMDWMVENSRFEMELRLIMTSEFKLIYELPPCINRTHTLTFFVGTLLGAGIIIVGILFTTKIAPLYITGALIFALVGFQSFLVFITLHMTASEYMKMVLFIFQDLLIML